MTLPFDSSLLFVLDNPISSNHSKPNDIIRVHLKSPLMVAGKLVAPAGTPTTIRIVHAVAAQAPDIYGYVDIFFEPLPLPDGRMLPLRAPTAHLSTNISGGQAGTVGVEDTIGDIFIPGHVLYHAFRKGRNFELGVGSEIRARTLATISVNAGAAVITTPQPFAVDVETPRATFVAVPLATPSIVHRAQPPKRDRGAQPSPSPTPSASPSPNVSSSPEGSPSPSSPQ